MPLIDVECKDCTFKGEGTFSVNEKLTCPQCSSENVERIWSVSNIEVYERGLYDGSLSPPTNSKRKSRWKIEIG